MNHTVLPRRGYQSSVATRILIDSCTRRDQDQWSQNLIVTKYYPIHAEMFFVCVKIPYVKYSRKCYQILIFRHIFTKNLYNECSEHFCENTKTIGLSSQLYI